MKEIKVAIIGYGGIARMHNTGYHTLVNEGVPVKLVAVCDKYADKFKEKTSINLGEDTTTLPEDVHFYTDMDELIANEDFDAADICLPTFMHADVAVKFLSAGKHVLCEKPMALSTEDSARMLEAKNSSGRRLMVGHCLRYMPAYVYLRECIKDGVFGKLESLSMNRHSVYPTWGADRWHDDKAKCGGCLIDTHIHDVDVARYLLGEPDRVSALTFENIPHYQYVNTRLHFGEVGVVIDGSWDDSYTEIFRADYRARFERATVYFDFERVTVFPNGGEAYSPDISTADAYTEEIRRFITLVADCEAEDYQSSAECAHVSMHLVEAIAESAAKGGEYINFKNYMQKKGENI